MFICEFCQISKNTFSNRTPPVVAIERWKIVKRLTLQRNFFTQATGNGIGDYYARNVYIKVFLLIAGLWMLVSSKILHQNNKFVYIYIYVYNIYIYSYNTYLPSLPDLSGVSQFKKSSPGATILVCFLPVSTEPLFFLCLHLNG